jgi:chromosome segregation ATPase
VLAAFVLLAVAGVLVAGAIVSGSWLVLTAAAAASVVLGGAATRITYTELGDTRRDAARDRAELARDYRDLSAVRTAEHHRYVTGVEAQLNDQRIRITKVEGALEAARAEAGVAQRRLVEVTARAERAETRGTELAAKLEEAEEARTEAIVRVIELEHEVDVLTAQWQTREAQRKHA